jgi:lysophospholipid acyltransferase (LPLAT)-like uncharacterized protein
MASHATATSYGFVPWLASAAVGLLARTWRVDVVEGREVFEGVLARREPMIWCLWHNRIAAGAGLLVRRMVPSGSDYTLLTSASRDGALSAAVAAGRGMRVVRGSSSRGGARALLDVIRTVKGHGSSPILVPDGPRGPAYEVKPGVLKIAAKTGLPILSVGFAAPSSSATRRSISSPPTCARCPRCRSSDTARLVLLEVCGPCGHVKSLQDTVEGDQRVDVLLVSAADCDGHGDSLLSSSGLESGVSLRTIQQAPKRYFVSPRYSGSFGSR